MDTGMVPAQGGGLSGAPHCRTAAPRRAPTTPGPLRPTVAPSPEAHADTACSLERYARHTQTVNLYAPLTLRFGLTHDRPCSQVWSGGRLAGPR